MNEKLRVGIINYLNVKPFLYGIRQSPLLQQIELVETFPSRLAGMLLDNEVDLGIVPVAILPEMKEYHIVSDYCIGCDGPVASVCLFSEVPIGEIETVWLDYQSRTSVMLAQILLKNYWRTSPGFRDANGEEYRHLISGTTAGVVIGDRAFEQRKKSTYIYDLGEAWKAYTGLNFVFAAWIANKPLPENFIEQFNQANAAGINAIDKVVEQTPYSLFDLNAYYRYNINYRLDDRKRAGMEEFLFQLEKLKRRPVL